MSRRRRTLAAFAARAGMQPELALALLRERSSLKLKEPGAVVAKSKVLLVEMILGLAPRRVQKEADRQRKIREQELKERQLAEQAVRRARAAEARLASLAHMERIRAERAAALNVLPLTGDGIPLVGRRQEIVYLPRETVEKIHWFLVKEFAPTRDPIVPPGVKEMNLLESAMTRCRTSLGRDVKYPTLPLSAAALLHSLIHNHPFHNGNKRTALVSCLTFLDANDMSLRCLDDELFAFVMHIGAHGVSLGEGELATIGDVSDREVWAIARWMHSRMYKKAAPTRHIRFRELRRILNEYGCALETPVRGFVRISRGHLRTQIWYGGEGREVDASVLHKVRHDLELDEAHGCDSSFFYDAEERLPDFVTKYRKTLDRLAKM